MKRIIFILLILLVVCSCNKKTPAEDKKTESTFKLQTNDTNVEYAKKVYLHDLINDFDREKIISENILLDTYSLGKHIQKIEYSVENEIITENIEYNVVDTTKPLLLVSSSYTITEGSNTNLVNKAICADNYDKRPNCYIEGDYDVNTVGTYNLIYNAIDSSNNKSSKKFKLKVVKPTKDKKVTANKPKFKIQDLIKKHKTDKTMIGIDVSSWQGNVDYKKVKDSGVEFVMIRLGYGHNKEGKLVLDNQFKNNIKNAKKEGLLVGLYFFSYANTIDKVKEQVNYIVKNLDGEKLDLPIAFDWENWSKFNTYNVSLTDMKIICQTFIDEVKKNGYDGMLYSSKYYLEQIWGIDEFDTWLAHYTDSTSYKGKYKLWQLSNRGKVPGINGDVDLDILYK